ncbi:hypothetical protein GQ43DRAFT_407206 [Delitschia confertaspora ATCC 74209]|uniref:MIF4G like protein n=1 Tax=Delitschia confertaspora ATCC 74209 TaxID=1513339 RepID=A0A9P4JXX6_9PLEO|nr:hypothetical protein GQ43DRAFT_407206 [Delitschia confertaspora ATCC 74209]
MADEGRFDRRRDGGRDGGRDRGYDRGYNRGYNNNRKRRYEDDEDNDRAPPRRRRYEEPSLGKLRRMLLEIAETSMKLPEDEAKDIARLLGDTFEEGDLRTKFFDIFVQLLIDQPFKIPFAAAVVFYANDTKPEITTEALKRTTERILEAVNEGDWKEFKLLLRFFACLQNLFEGDGVFTLLHQLFDSAVDLQSANENDVVGLELVKIILLTIPYALVAGGSDYQGQASELLQKTEIVASMKLPLETIVEPYAEDSKEKPFPYHSIIGLLQTQLQNEAGSGWEFGCIPRFSKPVPRHLDGESAPTSHKHPFPAISLPSPVNPGTKPLFPEAFFSLYADQEVETVPPTSNIAASLLRDAIVDTIDQLDFNRIAAAKLLVEVDCYWQTGTFVPRATGYDKLKDIPEGQSTWKPEDMVVDAVFSQIFKLPNPEHKLVYYHSVITEACKIAPAAIAPSLGRAIRFIFKNVDVMDLELSYRFLDWFSHHLSNFEFRWKWTEWTEDLQRPDLHPKKAFISAALEKEIRLSFAKRIRSTVPEDYHPLISAGTEKDRPDFKYDDDQTPFSEEGKKILVQIKKKVPDSEIQETIEAIHTKAAELGIGDVMVPSTDAFVTSICCVGSKSLSHVLFCIERHKERLLSISQTSEAARRQIVSSVVKYWKDQPGVAVYILDKLLNYSILVPMTLAQWAFLDHLGAGEGLADSWVYEILWNTVGKVVRSLRTILTVKLKTDLQPEQRASIDKAFPEERERMRDLFAYIQDSLKPVAEGSADRYLEKSGSGELSDEDAAIIREWGKRWLAVFTRKALVEEAVVGELAVEAKVRLIAAEAETESQVAADGHSATNDEDEQI